MKIVLTGIFYPMAILRYFENALKERDDVELFSVGPHTGNWIPWEDGMVVHPRYGKPPNLALEYGSMPIGTPFKIVENQLPWNKPDLIINVDAGFYFTGFPKDVPVAHVATDPHVLQYDIQRGECSKFFNMQRCYMKPGDIYLPYAADPSVHYPIPIDKDFDAVLIGLHYEDRVNWVNHLRNRGLKVHFSIGEIFDEYRETCNRGKVGLSWSSKDDLIARVFETMAMKICLVTNFVPDIEEHFENEVHYLGFENMGQAIEMVVYALENKEVRQEISENGFRAVHEKHTYNHRIQQIIDEMFK